MLQNIRDNSQGLIAKVIIGLIVITFALFGIENLVGGGGPAPVASINDEEVSPAELEQAVNAERRRLLNLLGESADPSMFDDKLLRSSALQRIIQQRLLAQAAADASVSVPSAVIDQAIIAMPQFQEDGRFSSQLYQNVLRSNGYTPAFFKQLMAEDMVVSQLNGAVASSEFITEAELESVAKIIGQNRSFRYFLLPKDKLAAKIDIDDSDIEQYYQQNIASFQTEDEVKVEYIEIKPQDFFEPVTPEALQEAYKNELAGLKSSEVRRASHILIEVNADRNAEQAQQLASELSARVGEGESFAALAEEYSDDKGSAHNGGDVGFSAGDTFPPEFEKALLSLQEGETSAPVKTDAGYHVIKATEVDQGEKPTFADREEVLKKRIQLDAAEVVFVKTVEHLRDLVFNSEGLSGPAKELGLNVQQSELISRSSAKGVLARSQVLGAMFSSDVLEEGNNSEVLELAPDHYIVVHVVQHRPPQSLALEDVKPAIVKTLSQQQSTELLLAMADTAISALNAGASVEELAREEGYEWQVELNVTRNTATADRALVDEVFSMPQVSAESYARKAVTLPSGDVAIVQLEAVIDGRWEQFSMAEQQALKAELQRNVAGLSFAGFMHSLRDSAEVQIY
ncbi:MAG: SurA N-terminal domain-containing protein [Spongiibacteraceae bacterium]